MHNGARFLYTAHSSLKPKPGQEEEAQHFMTVIDRAIGIEGGDLGRRWVDVPAIDHVLALKHDRGSYRFEFIASAPLRPKELRLLELSFTAMEHDAPCEAAFQWDLQASDPALREALAGRRATAAAGRRLH